MKKILITGSGGFLGSNLAEYLTSKKNQVIGISNEIKNSTFKQLCKDVRTISSIPKDVSCIVHFAALTDVDYCQKHPKDCFDTNVGGTFNMLELARKNDLKFIFTSTSQIFGIPKKLPISEDTELNPLSMYATSKVCGEFLCQNYAKSYGLDIIVVRAFSIYGPKSPSYLVTTKIITQILKQNKIKIGNSSPKRDFLYVSDLVSAFELLINKNLKGFTKYNIGLGKSISIYELCQKLIKISGKDVKIEYDKRLFRKSEIPDLVCDPSKIKKLGWRPKVLLDEGLALTFNWLSKQLQ